MKFIISLTFAFAAMAFLFCVFVITVTGITDGEVYTEKGIRCTGGFEYLERDYYGSYVDTGGVRYTYRVGPGMLVQSVYPMRWLYVKGCELGKWNNSEKR